MLLSVIMSTVLSLVPCALAQPAGHLDRFRNVLEQDGFDVQPGRSKSLDMWEQYCGGVTSSAKYNNKGAPYLTAVVPHLPEEFRTLFNSVPMRPSCSLA